MSGHTRWSSLVCLEIDGVKVAHTGDQMFFDGGKGEGLYSAGAQLFTNHVYKNGLDARCYLDFLDRLKAFSPDWILTGHRRPYQVDPVIYDAIAAGAAAFDELHETVGGAPPDGVHFGYEGRGGELLPYRVHLPHGGAATLQGWVLNPFPVAGEARVAVVAPAGWTASPVATMRLGPRAIGKFSASLEPPTGTVCRRLPIALDLTVNDRPFGHVAEALVTAGGVAW
jgi:hypothetical protein